MTPLQLTHYTATSWLGRGLPPCYFDTVELATWIGEVAGVDEVALPQRLARFDCRNNRLAQLGLMQDGFDAAVRAAVARYGSRRVGVFLGTSTSRILTTEIAYRHLDRVTGALPAGFDYAGT